MIVPVLEEYIYLTYKDYVDRWDEIYNIFSREAVFKGAFDQYAESTTKKRGTQEVDDAFLKEIEGWRELFAKNIALRNKELTVEELKLCSPANNRSNNIPSNG